MYKLESTEQTKKVCILTIKNSFIQEKLIIYVDD